MAVDIVVFAAGAASGIVSIAATNVQHGYYENVRDLKRQLEVELGLSEHAITTTKGQGGIRNRIAKVQSIQKFMLGALIVANLTGFGVSIAQAVRASKPPKVELAVQLVPATESAAPVVLSQHGEIKALTTALPGNPAVLEMRPGRYLLSVLVGSRLCVTAEQIMSTPLQTVAVKCAPASPARKHRLYRGKRSHS